MKKNLSLIACLLLLGFITACEEQPQELPANAHYPQTKQEQRKVTKERLEEWLGKWDGPEGTYMIIGESGDGYNITIKDLDKEERYLGVAQGMKIKFLRGDTQESIYFGPGRDSGMKWLMDKPYCLIVKKGEAYCRDKM